jgi:hypothetical protein
VTDPTLVKTILRDERNQFPKTPVETRLLGALWAMAPQFRHADIPRHAPAMALSAAKHSGWRTHGGGTVHCIAEDMTHAAFHVISDPCCRVATLL